MQPVVRFVAQFIVPFNINERRRQLHATYHNLHTLYSNRTNQMSTDKEATRKSHAMIGVMPQSNYGFHGKFSMSWYIIHNCVINLAHLYISKFSRYYPESVWIIQNSHSVPMTSFNPIRLPILQFLCGKRIFSKNLSADSHSKEITLNCLFILQFWTKSNDKYWL